MKKTLGTMVAVMVLAILIGTFLVSNPELRDLTIKRKQTLNELRPTLLKYKEDRGFFPDKLQDLVPDYLQAVPPELLNDGKEDIYKKITYRVFEGEARFFFSQIRGPDSRVTYHVSENRYEYDK